MRAFATTALLTLTALNSMAQDAAPSWLEHTLHGNGKINTVVAVVAIIILGLGDLDVADGPSPSRHGNTPTQLVNQHG
jgi:type IV secretory pathway VirB2 component (pilin)